MPVSIALDLGSSSVKGGLLGRDGKLADIVSIPVPPIAVSSGRYESDALAYAAVAEEVLKACMARPLHGMPLGMCSQRSSFLLWESGTGKPVTPLVSWQDNRGAGSCEALKDHGRRIRELSGLPLTPYYLAPKLRQILLERPGLKARLESGEWLAGTLDTFLIWRWSNGRYFVTDASMAARTQLLDIHTQQWSEELCELFGIPVGVLPRVRPSTGMSLQLDNGLVLQASVGDQSAALFAGLADGNEAMVNVGTGGFVVRYLSRGLPMHAGYLETLVYLDRESRAHFAAEGTLNSIASALAPYPVHECLPEDLARQDIFCLAEPSGVGAPYFRADLGITFSHPTDGLSDRQIATLLLEAIIFRIARILEDFHGDAPVQRAFLSGGLSELAPLGQGIASCVPFEVLHLREKEASLLGAARLAAGLPPGCERVADTVPVMHGRERLLEKYRRWKDWLDAL